MSKTCARCQKVVYPIEELKCLDKIWHKTCFKCTECSMTLNMKTYKGFNKLPYCEAHIPKVKATAIADTPELKRIAENTKIQSNVKYHEDFEKAKGKFTQVADDPETLRIKQNTKIISNVAYHGDLEKKAIMEKQREAADLGEVIGESEYFSETLAAAQFSQFDHMPGITNTTPLLSTISNSTPQQQPLPQPHQSFQQEQHISNQNHLQQLPLPQQSMHMPQNSAITMNNSQVASHANTQMLIRNQPQQHSDLSYQHYQQQQETHTPQNQQHMQQQILNTQKPSTYNQLRSTILLNSHHPTGGMQQSVQSRGSNNPTGNISSSYDQQDVYTNPSSQAANLYHPNHSNNNSIMNNSTAYPIQKTQHYANDNMNTSKSLGSNNYNNSTAGSNMNNSILQQQKVQHSQQSLSNGSNVGNVNMIMKNMTISGANGAGVGGSNNIGKIADYDPLTDGPRQLPNTSRPSTTLVYSSGTTRAGAAPNQYTKTGSSVPDLHLANGIYGVSSNNNHPNQLAQQQQRQQYYRQMIQQQQQQQQQQSQQQQFLQSQQQLQLQQKQAHQLQQSQQAHQQQQQQTQHSQQHHSQYTHQPNSVRPGTRIYRALYDYEAQDVDEVSFLVDDIIYEVESIDSGWMTGRVERTGKTGMLPANYVETAVI